MAALSIASPDVANSDGAITLSKNNNSGGIRNFKIGFVTNFNLCLGGFGSATSGNTWNSTQFSINYSSGNVGIGTAIQYLNYQFKVLLILIVLSLFQMALSFQEVI